jgi:DNA-binding SARP family transcriptional activator
LPLTITSALAHYEYAKFLVQTNRVDAAENEFQLAVQVDPNNREARFVLASFYLVNKRYAKAEDAYKALAELDKDKPEGRSVLADYYGRRAAWMKPLQSTKKSLPSRLITHKVITGWPNSS